MLSYSEKQNILTNSATSEYETDPGQFDGIMHLNSLDIEQKMKTKMFAYNKAPFVQVVSGLRDQNCILTV